MSKPFDHVLAVATLEAVRSAQRDRLFDVDLARVEEAIFAQAVHIHGIVWFPVSLPPVQGRLVLLTGPSGIRENARPTGKDRFVCHGYYDESYRPRHDGPIRWLNVQNDELTDCGWRPTHWSRALELPR